MATITQMREVDILVDYRTFTVRVKARGLDDNKPFSADADGDPAKELLRAVTRRVHAAFPSAGSVGLSVAGDKILPE